MKTAIKTKLPQTSGQLVKIVTKANGWYAADPFLTSLNREREREHHGGRATAYVYITLPNHHKLPPSISNRCYDAFLAQLIGLVTQSAHKDSLKTISSNYRISLLMVGSSMDQAREYIEDLAAILQQYFYGKGDREEMELLSSVVISSYPLSAIAQNGDIRGPAIALKPLLYAIPSVGPFAAGSEGKNGLLREDDDSFYFNWNIFSISLQQPGGNDPVLSYRKSAPPGPWYPVLKRMIDLFGGAAGVLIFIPLMMIIAVAVKMTSPGPVLFRQKRIGYRGELFTFLKFRSMRTDMDDSIHREYVQKLIEGQNEQINNGAADKPLYKIAHDPRITPIGNFLRRTSLDELPQFINVLTGKMSLVGPRPPIPYEVDMYENWHLQRIMEAKPGITGIWQVYGRNQTTFDEMVKLDLKYIKQRSILLDLKIILLTITVLFNPRAGL